MWIALIAATCVAAGAIAFGRYYALFPAIAGHHYTPDFTVYWTAARIDPARLYDANAMTAAQAWLHQPGIRPWVNPPSFPPWVRPFGHLPFWWAAALWGVLNLTALLAAAWHALSWRAFLVLFSAGVAMALDYGQVTPMLAGLLALGVLSLPTRPVVAGLLLGLVATIKPQLVLVAPFAMIVGGHYRSLVASALVVAIAIAVSSAILGPAIWFDWLRTVVAFPAILKALNLDPDVLNSAHQVAQLFRLGPIAAISLRLMFDGLALFVVWWAFRRADPAWRLVAVAAGSIACSPYAPSYEVAMLAIPATMILWRKQSSPLSWVAAGWALAFIGPGAVAALLFAGPLDARYAEPADPEPAADRRTALATT